MGHTCPKCSSPCYLSLLGDIECSNPKCSNYSKELYPQPEEPKKADPVAEDSKVPMVDESDERQLVMYFWNNHHNDCGDV